MLACVNVLQRPRDAGVRVLRALRLVAACVMGAGWLVCAHSHVAAQSGADTSTDQDYRAAVEQAVVEYQSGHWAEAWAYFSRAHELRPSARTLRSLGLVAFEQRRYVVALAYFSQALQSQDLPLTDEMRAELEKSSREARSFVSVISLSTHPESTQVLVDGEPAHYAPDRSLTLDAGPHELVISAPGHITQTRMLTANGAERRSLSFVLQPEAPLAVETPSVAGAVAGAGASSVFEPPAPQVPRQPLPSSAAADAGFLATRTTTQWVGLGVAAGGVVAAAVGATYSVLAMRENSASAQGCARNVCDADGLGHREAALFRADVATVAFVVAGVLGAAGATTYWLAPSEQVTPSGGASLQASAAVSGRGLALGLTGRF